MVAAGTLSKLAKGELLYAPCLKDLEGKNSCAECRNPGEKNVWIDVSWILVYCGLFYIYENMFMDKAAQDNIRH